MVWDHEREVKITGGTAVIGLWLFLIALFLLLIDLNLATIAGKLK